MTDEVDVDAMLEAPLKNPKADEKTRSEERRRDDKERSRDKNDKHRKSTDADRKRSRSRDRERSDHHRSNDRDRDRDRGGRDRERDRYRDRGADDRFDPERRRSRSPWSRDGGGGGGRYRGGGGGGGGSPPRRPYSPPSYRAGGAVPRKLPGPERRDVMPFTPRYSPPRGFDINAELTPEDRDLRTVFCMQLARTIRPRDLEEFFSSVGRVRDVRIITDSKTRRSKGIGYVEFWDTESVPLALGLTGQRLLNAPIVIQPTQSEKNRMASAALMQSINQAKGPMKLYVGSLHFNITEDMLRGIFEPFGRIESIQVLKDTETNRSRGYGFVTFYNSEDAKRAMEQLNGFELAGRPIKVSNVTDHGTLTGGGHSLDSDEMDRAGIDLGTTGRLQLMAKLAEGTGMQLPQVAQQMLNMQQQQAQATPPIATQCFMLSNMFDPVQETDPNWDTDIREDVIEECNKHGGVLHIFVDKTSPQGNVYVKCPTIASAVASVTSLHGRWFSGKIITANYVPVANYHQLFPDAVQAMIPLTHGAGYYTR